MCMASVSAVRLGAAIGFGGWSTCMRPSMSTGASLQVSPRNTAVVHSLPPC